jgi:hypothetical protein
LRNQRANQRGKNRLDLCLVGAERVLNHSDREVGRQRLRDGDVETRSVSWNARLKPRRVSSAPLNHTVSGPGSTIVMMIWRP